MRELFDQVNLAAVPVRDKAHEVLKRAIIEGRLAPGQRLVESQIADGLSVSRTPLREAILRLEAEGFLARHANGAVHVKPLAIADVEGLYATRSVLEGLVAREAARRITDAQLSRLEVLLGEIRKAAEPDADLQNLARVGEEFHEILIDASGNTTCASLLHVLRDRIAQHRRLTIASPRRRRASARELATALAHLRRRDAEGAERAMRAHVVMAGRCLLERLNAGALAADGERKARSDVTPKRSRRGTRDPIAEA